MSGFRLKTLTSNGTRVNKGRKLVVSMCNSISASTSVLILALRLMFLDFPQVSFYVRTY